MERREIIIDGSKFSNLEEFYDEMERILTKNLTWRVGRNLDAFNDLLRGGFGVHEYGEALAIKWLHADKSRCDLGYEATVNHWEKVLTKCHPSNIPYIQEKLDMAKSHKGDTLFDIIIKIILDSEDSGHYCTLELEDQHGGADIWI